MSQFYGKVHYKNTFDEGAVQKMTYSPADLDIDNPGGYNYEFTAKIKTLPIMSPHDAATFAKFPKLFALSGVPGQVNKRKRRKPARSQSDSSTLSDQTSETESTESEIKTESEVDSPGNTAPQVQEEELATA